MWFMDRNSKQAWVEPGAEVILKSEADIARMPAAGKIVDIALKTVRDWKIHWRYQPRNREVHPKKWMLGGQGAGRAWDRQIAPRGAADSEFRQGRARYSAEGRHDVLRRAHGERRPPADRIFTGRVDDY